MKLIALTIAGQPYQVQEGITVAAALSLSGEDHCRISVSQQPRAPFCGMGVVPGMPSDHQWLTAAGLPNLVPTRDEYRKERAEMNNLQCEVLIIGLAPAGLAAALAAGESRQRIIMIDDNPRPGGQNMA
ncbi:sarcosine oxidase, alpha subunit family [Serratia fonticola]|uniref:Sarcosine oxidase, alpha subunit family n=1 Tax=Serratia fonticola TaxID=47917 RepID=A0A4U9TXF0_SERFO|nr:sarcosine oxidase, alpha subunit family [Serratia fonticola]